MLDNKEKKNPFMVPENYFQDFNAEIMNKLPENEGNKKKIVPLWKSVTKWVAAAAVVTGIAFVGVNQMEMKNSSPVNVVQAENNISSDDSEAAIENDYYLYLEEEAAYMAYNEIFSPN